MPVYSNLNNDSMNNLCHLFFVILISGTSSEDEIGFQFLKRVLSGATDPEIAISDEQRTILGGGNDVLIDQQSFAREIFSTHMK